jgi:hypothetical protein
MADVSVDENSFKRNYGPFKTIELARGKAKEIMNSGKVPNQPIWVIRDLRDGLHYLDISEDVFLRNFEEVVESI